MRDFSTPRTFILSAERIGETSIANERRTDGLRNALVRHGIPHREVSGMYEGTPERSFLVTGASNQAAVAWLADLWDQDTYLCIAEHDRTAYLVHVNSEEHPRGYHQHLGKLVSTGATQPPNAWTKVDGVFYTVEPRVGVDLPEGL